MSETTFYIITAALILGFIIAFGWKRRPGASEPGWTASDHARLRDERRDRSRQMRREDYGWPPKDRND